MISVTLRCLLSQRGSMWSADLCRLSARVVSGASAKRSNLLVRLLAATLAHLFICMESQIGGAAELLMFTAASSDARNADGMSGAGGFRASR